jgi:hypothetical protein
MKGSNTNANGRPYTLEETLTIYESFHVLEAHKLESAMEQGASFQVQLPRAFQTCFLLATSYGWGGV